jgi:hypothetical protein
MLAYRANPWISFIGAIAYTFSTFNFISIEAGHLNKVFDMALMAPVLAGIVLVFRGKYLTGAAVTIISASLQIYYAHLQITYYLLFIIVFYAIGEFIYHVINKNIKEYIKGIGVLSICAIIAVGPNVSKLWTNAEYVKSTTRGPSELTAKKNEGGGLDKEYALDWSNGIAETFTILIPNFYGGSSNEEVGTNSDSYKALLKQGASKAQAKEYVKALPLYWGDQPFTSGPVYFGAIVCFFFVLGMIILEGRYKWWLFGVSLLAIMLSWGRNFPILTDLFFYHFPLYNKFRSVTMIMSIAQLTFPLLAFLALLKISNREIEDAKILNGVKISLIITGGVVLLFALFGSMFFNFSSPQDEKQLPEWLIDSLIQDREHALRMDAFRSLALIIIAAGLVWFYIKNKFNTPILYAGFAIIILIDLWPIDKRYLGKEDFRFNKGYETKVFNLTPADEQILQDKDPDFRVFNQTSRNPFSDAVTSYHHKSIGGYSAIKLGRYQELIDYQMRNGNRSVFNMLNTKYYIFMDSTSGNPVAIRNPESLGHAWIIDSIKVVPNADEEIKAISKFDPKTTAILDQRFNDYIKGFTPSEDPSATINLTSYHPNRLKYEIATSKEDFVVFSEIYYKPGWQAYIDGKPTEHVRVDYVLRGMRVPVGKHTVEFKFEPQFYFTAEKISKVGSILLIISIAGIIGIAFISSRKEKK